MLHRHLQVVNTSAFDRGLEILRSAGKPGAEPEEISSERRHAVLKAEADKL